MKKTKLLIPMIGVTMLSSGIAPLITSCSSSSYCVIKFNSNGGSSVSSIRVKKGECATKPTDPTKEGLEFSGWYTDSQCTSLFDWSTPVTASITLYAGWTDGKITSDQWVAAFTQIATPTIARNFTINGTLTQDGVTASTYEVLTNGYNAKQTTKTTGVADSIVVWDELLTTKIFETTKIGSQKPSANIVDVELSTINAFLLAQFGSFVNLYLMFTFDSSTHTYNYVHTLTQQVISVKFDGQHHVSSFSATTSATGHTVSYNFTFSNYGTTEITDMPEDSRIYLDEASFAAGDKQMASKNFDVSDGQYFVIQAPISKMQNFDATQKTVCKFVDSNVSIDALKTITVMNGSQTLTMGTDYTVSSSSITINENKLTSLSTLTLVFAVNTSGTTIFTNFKIKQ